MTRRTPRNTPAEPSRGGPAALDSSSTTPAPKGKLGQVTALLRRPEGAGVEELIAATGWQAHTVRGAIAGALKRKHGLTILSEKTDAGRRYRIDAVKP